MGGKGGGYTYIIRELSQSKPVGFDSSPASVLALSGANAPALPKGEPLAKPVTWHLSRKLYRHARASPFGRGGSERSELTERARLLPRSAALPQEAGAANAVSLHDPTCENGLPERPQTLR